MMVRVVAICLLLVAVASSHAFAAKRVALVIGNGDYQIGRLKNPANDATDIAAKLRTLGFQVKLLLNADQRTMEREIGDFRGRLADAEIRLFYYAGHGMQVKGVNYLIPVNVDVRYEDDIKYEAVDAGRILDSMAATGSGANIIILDACRNNPFERTFRSSAPGLARMPKLDGSIIVYATAPGDVAGDGRGRNGIFTKHFLEYIDKPGLTLDQVFKRTGKAVAQATGNAQRPWLSLGLYDDIYLAGLPAPTTQAALAPTREERPTTPPKPSAIEVWSEPATGMEFVWIPGGCFQMGSPHGDVDEKPVHEVCVDGFWMGKYEVTNAQYRQSKADHYNKGRYLGSSLNGDRQPVVYVSWHDAKAYADWLSSRGNGSFRLPTEAEWEYAARAGTTTKRYWGDGDGAVCQFANVADETAKRRWPDWLAVSCADGYAVSAPVGYFKPNGFGLYDMMGNVWEWCQDGYDKSAYSTHLRRNPVHTGGGSGRVLRGGCWHDGPWAIRSASRSENNPEQTYYFAGFRLVRTNW